MSVGIQRKACRKMPQHTRHGLDVHSVLQCQRCEGVPQIVEPYLWQSCPRQYPEQHMQHAIWGDGVAVRRWEYILTSYFFSAPRELLLYLQRWRCCDKSFFAFSGTSTTLPFGRGIALG